MRRFWYVAGAVLLAVNAWAETWVEDNFDDFADGTFDDGGQNLFVSRDGSVRTIHRFDLNHDGWIDLLFNSTHDIIGILPATAGWWTESGEMGEEHLPVEGALRVAAADFNRDGWQDLAFCPNRQGIQHPRRFVTVIYGGADGWPASRSNGILPVHGAVDMAVVDLNADEWPDIAVLNGAAWLPGQPEGAILRVFWGGAQGFQLARYGDYGIEGGVAMVAGYINDDEALDLTVLQSTGSIRLIESVDVATGPSVDEFEQVELPDTTGTCIAVNDANADGRSDFVVGVSGGLLLGARAKGTADWKVDTIGTDMSASHIAIADVDGDGHRDLVLTDSSIAHAIGGEAIGAEEKAQPEVRVLWGGAGSFRGTDSSNFRVPYATRTAVGDVDADGQPDLVSAVYRSTGDSFTASSVVHLGHGDRKFSDAMDGPSGSGMADIIVVPPEKSLPARVVVANSQGGHVDEQVPLDLYWGGPEGFSTERHRSIPFASGYEATAADFNADGYTDLMALCSGHAGGSVANAMTQLGANIYWGKAGGVDFDAPPTVLREHFLYSSNVADLNKDGYLDIVLGAFGKPEGEEHELLVVYYGGADGYSAMRRTAIPSPGRASICAIADLNRDGWLDIGVTCYETDRVRLFWGGAEGYSQDRQQILLIPKPIELETADLNADGWLDLIAGSYADPVAKHQDTGSIIFWGGEAGYAEWNAQRLPGYTPVGYTVADWDADGYLDLFSTHYHGELTREQLPSYLYWGGPDGFATRRRTVLICDSPSDSLAADFDRDGLLDVAVACHTRDGNHATDSKVFYNDGKRFESPRVTKLPTVGPHWMYTEDMGHIAHRRHEHAYLSSAYTLEDEVARLSVKVDAEESEGTSLSVQVRSAASEDALANAAWRDVEHINPVNVTDRVFQYRVVFASDNGDRYPVLNKVSVSFVPN